MTAARLDEGMLSKVMGGQTALFATRNGEVMTIRYNRGKLVISPARANVYNKPNVSSGGEGRPTAAP